MVPELSYPDRLKKLGLWFLKEQRICADWSMGKSIP